MTHQILTRFFVASLFILGEGAYASEVNPRSDIAATAIGNTVQSLSAIFLDEPKAGSQLILNRLYLAPTSQPLSNNTLYHSAFIASQAIEYSPANPRAPPVPV